MGCDRFTQNHYKNSFGIDFPLGDGSNEEEEFHIGKTIKYLNTNLIFV